MFKLELESKMFLAKLNFTSQRHYLPTWSNDLLSQKFYLEYFIVI